MHGSTFVRMGGAISRATLVRMIAGRICRLEDGSPMRVPVTVLPWAS